MIRNICDLSRLPNMTPPKTRKEKGVTAVVKDGKLIKKRKSFSLQEELEVIARVEAGEKLPVVGRFYSINESTVRCMVKSKDAIKSSARGIT